MFKIPAFVNCVTYVSRKYSMQLVVAHKHSVYIQNSHNSKCKSGNTNNKKTGYNLHCV